MWISKTTAFSLGIVWLSLGFMIWVWITAWISILMTILITTWIRLAGVFLFLKAVLTLELLLLASFVKCCSALWFGERREACIFSPNSFLTCFSLHVAHRCCFVHTSSKNIFCHFVMKGWKKTAATWKLVKIQAPTCLIQRSHWYCFPGKMCWAFWGS